MKQSSYQKLKAEIAELHKDIRTLVMSGEESAECFMMQSKWRMRFHQEDAVMFGSGKVSKGGGITAHIKMMSNPYSSALKELDYAVLNPKNYSLLSSGLSVGIYYYDKIQETKRYMVVSALSGIVKLRAFDKETVPNEIIIVPGMIGYEERKQDE